MASPSGRAIDIVVGVTVSWVPLAADYTRFARTPRAAFWGTGVGYLLPDALLLALGAVILLTREVGDAPRRFRPPSPREASSRCSRSSS